MGCKCTKASSAVQDRDSQESSRKRLSSLSKRSPDLRVNSLRRNDGVWADDRYGLHSEVLKATRIDKISNGSMRVYDDQIEKRRREKPEVSVTDHPCVGRVPKATQGEQIAAGWPAWLSNAAGEAINGWVPRNANTFEKLDKVCSIFYLMLNVIDEICHWCWPASTLPIVGAN